jgi:uncharacterized protein (TIGR04222 family)
VEATETLAGMTSAAGGDDRRERPRRSPYGHTGHQRSQFRLLHLALFAVTVPVVVLARRRALAGPPGAAVPARLDPYEAAFLNGGSAPVATTAVTSLLRDGVLAGTGRRGRRVRLGVGAAPPAGADLVEWATYRLVAAQPDRTLAEVQAALGREPAVAAARLSTRPARLAATVAGPPRRLVVTVRAPALGEHWLSVPLG